MRYLGPLSSPVHEAAPEGDHLSGQALDREDDPATEAVERLVAALAPLQEADLQHPLLVEAEPGGLIAEGAPLVRGPAEAEALGDLGADAPPSQVGPGLRAHGLVEEPLPEPLPRERVHLVERSVGVLLLPGPADLAHLDARPARHVLHRLHEVHPLTLHDEGEDVPDLPQPKHL